MSDNFYKLKNFVSANKRLTVGYLDENAYMEQAGFITAGIIDAAEKNDMNVIRFGHYDYHNTNLESFTGQALQHILQYDIDGLMFLGWAGTDKHKDFRQMFDKVPLYSIASGFPDIPHTYFPGDQYVKELLLHLLDHHNYRRIAFVEPFWKDARADIYVSLMKERGVYDPHLLVERSLLNDVIFNMRGRKAVSILLDERKVEFDAIVSLYNFETKDLLDELLSRGLKVPGDIAVTSYEESDVVRFSSPPITTVYFPYRELGYVSCEKMAELLRTGKTPFTTKVEGRIIYRETCGCLPQNVLNASAGEILTAGIAFDELTEDDLRNIEDVLGKELAGFDISALLEAFCLSFRNRCGNSSSKDTLAFLDTFEKLLGDFENSKDMYDKDVIVGVFRKILLPYFIPYLSGDIDCYLWAENMFQQAQVLYLDKKGNALSSNAAHFMLENNDLQVASYKLADNYNRDSLLQSLEECLVRLGIPGCCVFVFNDSDGSGNMFENCSLIFEYNNGKRVSRKSNLSGHAGKILSRILFKEDRPYKMMAELLYVEEQPIGFVIFETGPMDQRTYSALAINLSTALRGTAILDRLESSYKRLVEQAHRKGMANIVSGALHNVANILNSINTSVQLVMDLVKNSPLNDFISANELLESNLENIEEFILKNEKGRKLMQYYTKLKAPITDYRSQLMEHIERLLKNIYAIEDIIAAQSNYTSNRQMLDELDIVMLIEDALLMNSVILQKKQIQVVRNYCENLTKPLVQKTKLLHVLVNIINNASESMLDVPEGNRILTITVDQDDKFEYIKISDTGRGIPGEFLGRIFEYGFTTKEDGHGFGLHTCAGYMAEMGGKLWAESEGAGKGATFVIRLRC